MAEDEQSWEEIVMILDSPLGCAFQSMNDIPPTCAFSLLDIAGST